MRNVMNMILQTRDGQDVHVRYEIEPAALERCVCRLARKLREPGSKQKVASIAHGAIRVWLAEAT